MRLRHIEVFHAVYTCGSITAAAKMLVTDGGLPTQLVVDSVVAEPATGAGEDHQDDEQRPAARRRVQFDAHGGASGEAGDEGAGEQGGDESARIHRGDQPERLGGRGRRPVVMRTDGVGWAGRIRQRGQQPADDEGQQRRAPEQALCAPLRPHRPHRRGDGDERGNAPGGGHGCL